jgi:hypothetical protein
MALNLKSLNIPSLNRKEVTDLKSSRKFPTEQTGTFREALLDYRYNPEETKNGKKFSRNFQATVKVLTSDNANHVGRVHTIRFYLDGDFQQYADRERRQFVASAMGQDPDDADFDCDVAQQTLVDTSEVDEKTGKNGFEPGEGEEYPCQFMHTRTNKTKERAAIKDGQPIIEKYKVANDFFAPLSS